MGRLQTCRFCGKEFTTSKHYQKYCSDECKRGTKFNKPSSVHKKLGSTEICAVCGKEFTVTHQNKKYCSDECRFARYTAYQRGRHRRALLRKRLRQNNAVITKTCKFCGRQFMVFLDKKYPDYCSPECRRAFNLLKMAYRNYIERDFLMKMFWCVLLRPNQKFWGRTGQEIVALLDEAKRQFKTAIQEGRASIFYENCIIRGDYTWALNDNEVQEVLNARNFDEALKIVQAKCQKVLRDLENRQPIHTRHLATSYVHRLPKDALIKKELERQMTCKHVQRQRRIVSENYKLFETIVCAECGAILDKYPLFG